MEPIANATESIEDFFARYTRYLTEGNIDGLADMYNYPALAVTARGCLAITESQQSRDFFSQGQNLYHSRQINGVRARDIVTEIEVPGIWVGHLVLENLDKSGSPVGQSAATSGYHPTDGTRHCRFTPPNAYNPDKWVASSSRHNLIFSAIKSTGGSKGHGSVPLFIKMVKTVQNDHIFSVFCAI
jgi:hypothetical protein